MTKKLLFSALFFAISLLSFGQATSFADNTPGTSKTWTVPNNVISVTVEVWGGGGSGGASTISNRGGGGGGGGGYSTKTIAVIPGQIFTYTVGSGGNGNSSGGNAGLATTLSHSESSTSMTANGGGAGSIANAGSATGGIGGTAIGGTNTNGNSGSIGNANGGSGGLSGSGGGTVGTGSTGGNGGTVTGPANAGNGGGGGRNNGSNRAGGNGASGQVKFSYTVYTFKSQIISSSVGAATWCPGETRTPVSVTIKNVGTGTWVDGTNGTPDFNIGVKWNDNGTSWNDYNVRVDAGNLAPNATRTYDFVLTASDNVGGTYGSALASGSNNLTFDVVFEAVAWFANNNNGIGPGNVKYTGTPVQTILPATPTAKAITADATTACPGTGTNINIATSELGVNYQLRNASNAAIGSPVAGTGGAIVLPTGNLASTTTFNVLGTATCTSNSVQMSNTVVVTVNSVTGNSVGTYTFCVDSSNTIATANVSSGNYALVNVTKGFTYTFSVSDVFASSEYLAVFNASNNASLITNNGTGGTAITNWVSTISGQVKVLLSAGGNCSNNGTNGGPISLNLTGVNNTQDDQLAYGTNTWIGHVYNITGAPPTTGAYNAAMISPSGLYGYVGYYTAAETFPIYNFGGNTVCFSTLTNGVNRTNIYTENFAVRYRMKSTRPAGCYMVTVKGDDGVRLFVDGVQVFDGFTDHGTNTYGNVMVYLNGNSDLVLDYYENGTVNEVSFDIVPFDNSLNTVTPSSKALCTGATQLLDGSAYLYNGGTNPTINYQWQRSTDNVTWTDLGVTTEDYTPPAITPATNTTYYYRRAVSAVASNASACVYYSNSTMITTSPSAPATPGSITRPASSCSGSVGNTFSIVPVTNATSYTWSVTGTGWAVTAGGTTTSATITIGSGVGTVSVTATNGCGTSAASTTGNITPTGVPAAAGVVSGLTTVCQGQTGVIYSVPAIANATGYTWTLPTGAAITAGNNTNSITVSYSASALTGSVAVQGTNACGNGTVSTTVTVTVSPTSAVGAVSGDQSICTGTSPSPITIASNTGAIQWQVSTNNTLFADISGANASPLTSAQMGSLTATRYYRAVVTSGGCTAATSGTVTVTVSPTSAVGAVSGDQSICTGTSPSPITIASNTGAIQWQVSTNNTLFVDISGANASPLTSAQMGSLTATRYYRAVVTSGGCTAATSGTVTVIVNTYPAITTQPQTLSLCVGQSGSFKVVPTAPAQSYQWEYSSDGVSGWQITNTAADVSGHTTTELSLTNVQLGYSGYYVRCVLTNGTCAVYTTPVQLTVNPLPTAPIASVTTQPTCAAPTATITVSSPAAGSGFEYSLDGTAYVASAVFTGVSAAPHYITVRNTSTGCESAQTPITVAPSATKKWNGSVSTDWNTAANWTPASVPTVADCVEIPKTTRNPLIAKGTGDFNMHTLNVDSDSVLTVGSGTGTPNTITVTNGVTVSGPGPLPGSVAGALIFENGCSLYQINTGSNINTGNITYKRDTSPVRRYDLTYWGSPVTTASGFTLKNLSPATLDDKYYSYNSTTDKWVNEYRGEATMIAGRGYNVRAPQTYNITGAGVIYTASFVGVPNNGDVSLTVVGGNWSLAGNPYPSAVDGRKFIGDNGTNVGTIYFWTHASNPSTAYPGVDKYNYNSDDFAALNLTGTAMPAPSTPTGIASSGYIAAGQGFFFRPSVNGTVTFTNDMRVAGSNTQFFKTANSNEVETNRVWLNLTNDSGAFKQILVGYVSGATNNYDINYDAPTTGSNSFIDFYSINDSRKLTIQGRAVSFDDTETVPLGYKSTIAGDFTIAIDHADGLFTDHAVYLEDKTAGKVQNLAAGNYTFTTAIGTFAERFVLHYTSKNLGTGDFENLENTVLVLVKDKAIKVTASKETIKDVAIYDVSGKLLYNKDKVGSTELQISNLQSSNQVLLLKVTLENNFTTTKKIIFK